MNEIKDEFQERNSKARARHNFRKELDAKIVFSKESIFKLQSDELHKLVFRVNQLEEENKRIRDALKRAGVVVY